MTATNLLAALGAITAANTACASLWPRRRLTALVLPLLVILCVVAERQLVADLSGHWWWLVVLPTAFLACVNGDPERRDPFAHSSRRWLAACLPMAMLAMIGTIHWFVVQGTAGTHGRTWFPVLSNTLVATVGVVGFQSYRRIASLRATAPSASTLVHLARTVAYALGAMSILMAGALLLLGPGAVSIQPLEVASLPASLIGMVLVLAAAIVASRRRPQVTDDLLRIDPLAYRLAVAGLTLVGAASVWSLSSGTTSVHGYARWYVALIAGLFWVLYAEELISTPVLLQLLSPLRRALVLAGVSGVVMGMAAANVITVELLPDVGLQLTMSEALVSFVGLLVPAITVAGCTAVLAFSSSPTQQVTQESAEQNILQGSVMYALVTGVSCLMASAALASLAAGTVLPIFGLWLAVPAMGILAGFMVTVKNNKDHFAEQSDRLLGHAMRSQDPNEQSRRRAQFMRRLSYHHRVQLAVPFALLLITGTVILKILDWANIQLPSGS